MTKRDQKLQQRLRRDDKKVLEKIYVLYKEEFVNYGFRYGLEREDLTDVYQDAIIAMHQNFVLKQTVLTNSTVKTYLFGIGKHKIFDRLKALKKVYKTFEEKDSYEDVNLLETEPTKEQKLLAKYFGHLSESCQDILKMFYYRNLTVKEMVKLSHYKDENTVKSHKSRCLKGLKKLIHNN